MPLKNLSSAEMFMFFSVNLAEGGGGGVGPLWVTHLPPICEFCGSNPRPSGGKLVVAH